MNERLKLENMIDEEYKLHEQNRESELHKGNFNALQKMYHNEYKVWYIPAKEVEINVWDQGIPMPVYQEDAYNHE